MRRSIEIKFQISNTHGWNTSKHNLVFSVLEWIMDEPGLQTTMVIPRAGVLNWFCFLKFLKKKSFGKQTPSYDPHFWFKIQRQLWDQWNGDVSDNAKFGTKVSCLVTFLNFSSYNLSQAHNGNDPDPKDDEAKLHSSARNFTEIPKPAESKQPIPSTLIQSFQPPNTSTPCHRSISHTGSSGELPMQVRNTGHLASPAVSRVARSPTQGLEDQDPGLLVLLEQLAPVLVNMLKL